MAQRFMAQRFMAQRFMIPRCCSGFGSSGCGTWNREHSTGNPEQHQAPGTDAP